MVLSRLSPVACLLAAATLAFPAHSFEMVILLGEIPDDTRELADQTPAAPNGEPSLLAKVPHRPWLTGSTVALTPDESRIVIADTDNHSVVVIRRADHVVLHRIGVGQRPERLVISPDGLVYVTNRGSRSVSVVDPVLGRELRSVDSGVEPLGIALSADGRALHVVSSATAELLTYDAKSLSIRHRVALPHQWPAAVTSHPTSPRVYVSYTTAGEVTEIERGRTRRTFALPTKDTGLPGRLMGRGETPRRSNLALALTVSPGGTRLFVAHAMADTGETRAASVAAGGYGLGAASPLVATISTFDLETGEQSRPKVNFQAAKTRSFAWVNRADQEVQNLAQAVALVHDPVRSRLVLVAHGADRIVSFDTRASDPVTRPIDSHLTGHAPKGVVFTRDGETAFVHNSQDYTLSKLGMTHSQPPLNDTTRYELKAAQVSPAFARSPLPAVAEKGRRLFTFALDPRVGGAQRFACASCHPDGRQDGLVWHVGAGPRQTPVLAGRVEGTGPFNWLGTEDALVDNIHQTMRRLGGQGVSKEEGEALSLYIRRYLPRPDNPHMRADLEQIARGRALFHDAEVGCATCHDPRRSFMDGLAHDVGTTTTRERQLWEQFKDRKSKAGGPPSVRPPQSDRAKKPPLPPAGARGMQGEPIAEAPVHYNTPSLVGLFATAPYYHDGSSPTLKHLLTTGNEGDRMGKTSHLSSDDIDALVAYLRTL